MVQPSSSGALSGPPFSHTFFGYGIKHHPFPLPQASSGSPPGVLAGHLEKRQVASPFLFGISVFCPRPLEEASLSPGSPQKSDFRTSSLSGPPRGFGTPFWSFGSSRGRLGVFWNCSVGELFRALALYKTPRGGVGHFPLSKNHSHT